MKVYAPGLAVTVIDGDPVAPAASAASGSVTVYAPGQIVEVRDIPSGETLPVLYSRALNMGKLLHFYEWSSTGRYERYIRIVRLAKAAGQKLQFVANDHDGSKQMLLGTYEMLAQIHGEGPFIVVGTATVTTPVARTYFPSIDLSGLPDGWHLFDIRRTEPDGSTAIPYWMYVGQVVPHNWAPVQTGSYGITHEDGPTARWGKVPATIDPPKFTLPPRDAVPFSHAAPATQMYRRNISPTTNGDLAYLYTTHDGLLTTMSIQGYAFNTIMAKTPGVVLRDGPFGVGTLPSPMHLEYGTANIAEMGGFVDNIYFTDPWSYGKIRYVRGNRSNSGEIVRLAGYRHGANGLELVGNWDAIPVERRGFNALWGMAWDNRTFVTNEAADPIPAERNLKPHVTGIALWLPDARNNRICHVKHDSHSHATPAVVTEFATGLRDPWDCVFWEQGNELIVSEREAHRIIALDPDTGAHLRTIIESPAGFGAVDSSHRPYKTATLEAIRAQACVLPEGLYLQDGWLYFASISMAQVKRVHLTSGAVEVVCSFVASSKSQYAKISVSDGTFGPRGTVFVSTWEVNVMGGPTAYLPDGKQWVYQTAASNVLPGGGGGRYEGIGYSMSSGVARGRLVYGGADYGIVEMSLAKPGDVTLNKTLYAAGKSEYERAGYRLTHGVGGFRQWKATPLPWGLSPAVDYFLTCNGHQQ